MCVIAVLYIIVYLIKTFQKCSSFWETKQNFYDIACVVGLRKCNFSTQAFSPNSWPFFADKD